jgi:hypothetical protein
MHRLEPASGRHYRTPGTTALPALPHYRHDRYYRHSRYYQHDRHDTGTIGTTGNGIVPALAAAG